jgi:3-isopropylmalate dehydrogenase
MTGQQRANPVGTILSLAMLLRTSLGLSEAGDAVEQAVDDTIAAGIRTPDIAGDLPPATTDRFGDEVAARI